MQFLSFHRIEKTLCWCLTKTILYEVFLQGLFNCIGSKNIYFYICRNWCTRGKGEKLFFVWCSPKICEMWYCSHNILDSSFTFCDLSSFVISMLSWCGTLRVIDHTTNIQHPLKQLSSAVVVHIQRWYTAKMSNISCFHLHKNGICLSIILYCGTIIGFYLMAIVGNFMG